MRNLAKKTSHTRGNSRLGARPWRTLAVLAVFAALGSIFLYRSFAANANLPGDVNNDNKVNLTDLSQLLSKWNTADSNSDVNSDGKVSLQDLSILLSNWNRTYTPGTPPPTTPPVGSKNFPAIHTTRSGLPWNSGTFVGGMDVNSAQTFFNWRGTPGDAYLTFADGSNWNTLFTINDSWRTWPGVLVLTLSPQPGGESNAASAAGQNNQRWRDYGSKLAAAGLNNDRTVLRIGWEGNGNWYKWAWGGQSNPTEYVNAIKNVVTSVKATAPNVKISINVNKNNKKAGVEWQRDIYNPLKDYLDIIGLDTYDMYGPAKNDAQWQSEQINQDPGLKSVSTWARANGKLMALEEWATIGNASVGGQDNPYYIERMWDWLNTNKDVIAYEIFYDHYGTSDYNHTISNGSKPNAAAAYRSQSRWGGGN